MSARELASGGVARVATAYSLTRLAYKGPSPWLLRQTGLAKLPGKWDPRERGGAGGAEAKPLAKAKADVQPRVVIIYRNPDPGTTRETKVPGTSKHRKVGNKSSRNLKTPKSGKQKFQEPQRPEKRETKVPGTSQPRKVGNKSSRNFKILRTGKH